MEQITVWGDPTRVYKTGNRDIRTRMQSSVLRTTYHMSVLKPPTFVIINLLLCTLCMIHLGRLFFDVHFFQCCLDYGGYCFVTQGHALKQHCVYRAVGQLTQFHRKSTALLEFPVVANVL